MQVDISKLPDQDSEDSTTNEEKGTEFTNEELIELVSSQIDQVEILNTDETDEREPIEKDIDEDALLKQLLAEDSKTTEDVQNGLSAEEELLLLEENEEADQKYEKEDDGTDLSTVPKDIWSVHRAGLGQNQKGVIRFAEDIEDLGGGITARRGRRNTSQPNNNRNKRGKGTRKRR